MMLFWAEVKRNWQVLRRYPLNLLMGMGILYIFFMGIFLGGRSLGAFGQSPVQFGESVTGLILGFLSYLLAMMAIGTISRAVEEEARTGTLEQLALSPYGLMIVLAVRVLADVVSQLTFIIPWIAIMSLSTGVWLDLGALLRSLPVLALTVLSLYGLGLILAALALIFKRMEMLLNFVTIAVAPLLMVPLDKLAAPWNTLIQALPLVSGFATLRAMVIGGVGLSELAANGRLAFLVVHMLVYFLLGALVFHQAERQARWRGMLGHY